MKPIRDQRTGRADQTREHYVVAAAVVFDDDLGEMRRQIAGVEATIGYALHYRDLSPTRRLSALHLLLELDGWDAYLFETASPAHHAGRKQHHLRSRILKCAFSHLSDESVVRSVLETRANPKEGFYTLDQKDHDVLRKLQRQEQVEAGFSITHADKSESLLAIADLLAGARTDWLCAVSREPFARIAHRVQRIVSL